MTAALDPEHALGYLALLSTDLRAAAVLSAQGELLAGDRETGRRAMALDGPERVTSDASGSLVVVRDERHAVAVALGHHAVGALALADVRTVLTELA